VNKRIGGLFALATVVMVAALAHHNMTALFDLSDRVTLNGTFTKVDWRNPHISLTVEAKDSAGKMETWQIEGPPPSFFRARDISKMDFENAIGKAVTAEASRARDKSNSGLMRAITLPGGKLVSACPQNC
jgi:hypothetical protein